MKHPEPVGLYLQKGLVSAQFPTDGLTRRQSQSRRCVSFDFIQQALHSTINLGANPSDGKCSKSSPKKRIQTAKYAEYAEKWNTSAYFVYSAVLSPFYFGDVFESSAFCAILSGPAAVPLGWRISRSVWSASSLLALSGHPLRPKAGASSTHSRRFARFGCGFAGFAALRNTQAELRTPSSKTAS